MNGALFWPSRSKITDDTWGKSKVSLAKDEKMPFLSNKVVTLGVKECDRPVGKNSDSFFEENGISVSFSVKIAPLP